MDSDQWDERYSTSELIWTGRANQFVEAHLEDLEPGTAIDLGAGEGRNSVWLASRGWTVTAVDFSRVGLDKADQLAAEHGVDVDTVCADATTWSPDAPVDLVVLSYLQLPSDQQRVVLEHAASWLAPGGTVFVVAHDRSNVEHGHGGPPNVDVCYTVEDTVAALDGLDVTRAEVAERSVDTPDGTKIALDTLVIAQRPL
jgi:2-polyprenyl-3-methyl-5-hydroxy-6-metoxy-1,4-benzoquinol methylase